MLPSDIVSGGDRTWRSLDMALQIATLAIVKPRKTHSDSDNFPFKCAIDGFRAGWNERQGKLLPETRSGNVV